MSTAQIPSHVPKDLVKTFDFFAGPGIDKDPFKAMSVLFDGPDIFFNLAPERSHMQQGSWVVTRHDMMRDVLQQPELFSSKAIAGFSRLLGEDWDLIPLELDPPAHTAYRMLLNPIFSPKKVGELEDGVKETAIQLIEAVASKGSCEFNHAFARPFPVTIFMRIMGLPLDQLDTFLQWETELLHTGDMGVRIAAAGKIKDYLVELMAERRANPRDDLASFAVRAEVDGKPLSDEQILGFYYLMFVGGLDTVLASLGFMFRYLATHPEQRRSLVEDPSLIPSAVEELLRAHSVVVTRRFLTQDTQFHGIAMKQGDCVTCVTALGSLDPKEFEDAGTVKFNRTPNRHLAFAAGPHRCLGSHLARRELRIALEEWLKRIPDFRIPEGAEIRAHGGVYGLDALPLEWDV